MAYFRAFCKVSIIREALRKARFSCMETYLLFGLIGEKLSSQRITIGFRRGLDVIGCGTGIVVRNDRSSSHSILRGRLGSGIDDRRCQDMDDRNYDEIVSEQNEKLRIQRNYYRRLHVDDLCILNAEEYYESLKDWSTFTEPRDTSERDAEKDSKVTFWLKCKSIFSDKAKRELEEKRKKAKVLQQEYEQYHQKRVNRMRAQFEEQQRKNHESVDEMKSMYAKRDKKQIITFFNAVLVKDYLFR